MTDLIAIGLFVLVCGSYAYTFRVADRLNKVIRNELHDLRARIRALEQR